MRFAERRVNRNAFTLIEVMIAVGVIGIVAAAIIATFNGGFFMMGLARENQRATQVILEKVETIRLYSWSQVNSNGFIPSTFTDYYDPQAISGTRGIAYSGTLEITNFPYATSYQSNMRQLNVTVSWSGSGNIRRTRHLSTYIAKDGVQNYVY
jgi:prepilin-type N-terminal cleavage/methylation domain-containing protein